MRIPAEPNMEAFIAFLTKVASTPTVTLVTDLGPI